MPMARPIPAAAIAAEPAPLTLAPRHRARLLTLARRGWPHEACGLLVGRDRPGGTHVAAVTISPNLNEERPRDRYLLDPGHWVRTESRARRLGLDVIGVWHTHPDHPARPSETDLAAAWEHLTYVIVATTRDGVRGYRAWRLASGGGAFVERQVEVLS